MTSMQTGMHYPIDLDAMPASWETGYVGDFALVIQPGFASGKHNKEGRGIPHIRPYNIDRLGKLDLSEIKSVAPDADRKRLHSGDVLFNNTNSPELIGKTSVIAAAGDWGFSNHMTRVAFSDAVSPKFAAYQLHYLWMRGYFLHNCVKHVNQASVSSTTLARAVPFVKPPRPQQDDIVAEIEKQFSRLDEAVANLKRVKVNLKRYKAAVLKAAVEGKLTEAWRKQHPNVEPASKLLERILVERREKWNGRGKYKEPAGPNPSLVPTLPKGWVLATAEQCTSVITDGEHITPQRSASGVLLLSARNILDGRLSLGDVDYVPRSEYDRIAKRLVINPGDVLLSCSGTVGRSTVAPEKLMFTLVRSVAVLKPLAAMGKYLSIALRSPGLQEQVSEKKTQTAQANIFQGKIKTLVFPLPPLTEQQNIVAEVEHRLSVIDELEATVKANLTRADRLRQAVLNKAFVGTLITGL